VTKFTHSYSWEGEYYTEWGYREFDVAEFFCSEFDSAEPLRELFKATGPGSEAQIRYVHHLFLTKEPQLRVLFEQPLFNVWAHRDLIPAIFEAGFIELGKFCVERLLTDFARLGCSTDALSYAFKDSQTNSCNLLYAYLHKLRARTPQDKSGPQPQEKELIGWLLRDDNKKRLAIDMNAPSISGLTCFQLAWRSDWTTFLLKCGGDMTARSGRGWTAVEETNNEDVLNALLASRGKLPMKALVSGRPGAAASYMHRIVWCLKASSASTSAPISLLSVTHIDEIVSELHKALRESNLIGYDHFIRIFSVIFRIHSETADEALRRPADKSKTVASIELLCKRVRSLTVKVIDNLVADMRSIALADVL
jgi:hypothetical protein